MNIIELLFKIESGEVKDGVVVSCSQFLGFLTVYKKELYFINLHTKQLEILSSKYIGDSIKGNYSFYVLEKEK